MNNKRIVKNAGVSMIMKPISMLLSFVYTPLALSFLGEEKYGVWVTILNVISWINYFDIGIGNGLRNKLTEAITLDDQSQAKRYVSSAYIGTTIVSLVFCIFVTLVWNALGLTDFFNLSVPDESANLIVSISILFVCINFVLSLSKTSAYAIQQPGIISAVSVVGQVLQIVIVLGVSRLFKQSLLAIALMYGIVSLFDSIIIYLLVTRQRNYLVPKVSLASKRDFKPLLTLGAGFFVLQICSLVLNTTDNLLISNLYGSAEVTPYSMVYKVFYMVVQIHAIIIMPMWSAYTEAATRRDMTWIRNTIKRINLITALLSVGVIIGIFLFEPLAAIWLQKRLAYGKPLIIAVAVYMVAQMIGNNYSSFLCGVGHIKISTIISGIGAVMNIPLSIYFAQGCKMRLTGIILGSLVVMMVSVIVLPIVSYRWLRIKGMEWSSNINA
jgi:Membrane protein involved in the export of O-antigen and teichoic acid